MERCLLVLGSVESNQRVSSDGLREDWQDNIHNYKCQDPSEIISTSSGDCWQYTNLDKAIELIFRMYGLHEVAK